MDERWLPIPGYEGSYVVSDQGRVRSVDRVVVYKSGLRVPYKGRVLQWRGIGQSRYPGVGLHRGGGQVSVPIHRLVLLAFVGPLPKGMHSRHLNGDHTDNRLCNLTYGTPTENAADKRRHGTVRTRAFVATHCARGHEYTPENTAPVKGGRCCRTCRRAADRESKRRSRIAGLPDGDPRHGTVSGYRNFACRCTPCRDANRNYDQSREQRKTA